ncbi:MAG TPA: prepilin-type N-terminal cleavage/methylation domain-containing protein [Nitrospirae bacterium]|nr:prepilin-type N-terminal cleavage/methylation domain-containing protein [Nitrospirota bacterium]
MYLINRKDKSGFTLLEVMVAVSILAIAVTVIFQIYSTNIKSISLSEKYLNALIVAEEKMNELSLQKEIGDTLNVTKTNDGQIIKSEIIKTLEDRTSDLPVIVYELKVTVYWQEGKNEKSVNLKTLRLVDKTI